MPHDPESYRAGAEAMREAAAQVASRIAGEYVAAINKPPHPETLARLIGKETRALPIPDAPAEPVTQPDEPPLTTCQAASLRNDGECYHRQCPEPRSGRAACPLAGPDLDEDDMPVTSGGAGGGPADPRDRGMIVWGDTAAAQPAEASAPVAEGEAEEAYKIGLREGREGAIQDLDLKAGGDGEYRGSTIPGRTVDETTMEQRIVDRIAALEAENARLRERIKGGTDFLDRVAKGNEESARSSPDLARGIYQAAADDARRARALLQEGRGNG